MKKQICSIVLLLSYSLSLTAANDVFGDEHASNTTSYGSIAYPSFIPKTREKSVGKTDEEPRQWLAYHPEEKPYVAIAATFDPRNPKAKKSAFYRVRELPGCILIALITGDWVKGNDALGEVLRNFLNSIDGDAVCADAHHSAERLGENMKHRASIFGKEIVEQEDKMLACGNAEEYKVAFASQWQRKPVSMHLVVAAAWCDLIAKDPQRQCRLMCWMPHESYDELTRSQETAAAQDRFINPIRYDALRPDHGLLFQRSGVLEPSDHQYRQLLKPQDFVCMTRAVGEHMKGSADHTHHIWMNVDLKALENAAKESISQEASQKMCHLLVDEELRKDQAEYVKNAQHVAQTVVAQYTLSHSPIFPNKSEAVERLTPLLVQVLMETRNRDLADYANWSSYDLFKKEVINICSKDYLAPLIVLDYEILQFTKHMGAKASQS